MGARFKLCRVSIQMKILLVVLHGGSSIPLFFVLDRFSTDPAFTPINATGHQLVTLCRANCAEERAQILDPIVTS